MTQREMNESFLAQIHNFDVGSEYQFQTHEVNIFLTKAYREVVNELYKEFEKSERIRKVLNPLVKSAQIGSFTTSTTYSNAYTVNLASLNPEVLYVLTEEVTTTAATKILTANCAMSSCKYSANSEVCVKLIGFGAFK